jgi:hypothetical protein
MGNIEKAKYCEAMKNSSVDVNMKAFWHNAMVGFMKRWQRELHK